MATVKLSSKEARSKLPPRHEPYWLEVDRGFSLGYRKSATGGTWYARRYTGSRYLKRRLGHSDDNQGADGIAVLSYTQARQKAANYEDVLETVETQQHPALYTVEAAIRDYLAWFKANRKAYETTKKTCDALILPALGSLPVARLTKPRIDKWLQELATTPPKTKNGYPKPPYAVRVDTGKRTKGKGRVIYEYTALPYDYNEALTLISCPACSKKVSPNAKRCPKCDQLLKWTDEMKRKRKSTANRVLTILKAALNHAWANEKVADAGAWQRVKPFKDVDAPKVAHLSEKQARKLLDAASDDFRPMAHAALLTGCRYGELARLRVADLERGQLYIAKTKTGKPRHVPLSAEGLKFFKALAKGKKRTDLLLTHTDGSAWERAHQGRPMREACHAAGIDPPVGFHVLRHTYATLLLRSDGSQGVSIRYVAELLGDSVATCVKHYGHVIQEDLRKEVARKLPSFGGA